MAILSLNVVFKHRKRLYRATFVIILGGYKSGGLTEKIDHDFLGHLGVAVIRVRPISALNG